MLVGDLSTLAVLWAVNLLAPYGLTVLMHTPERLVHLSSGMHPGGDVRLDDADPSLDDPQWSGRRWDGAQASSDTKLHDVLLALGVARRWPDVRSNAVNPGWVPTRMGGRGAPDDLDQAHLTQAWLAVSDDPAARVTGAYLHHQRPAAVHAAAHDPELQDHLLAYCRDLSGVALG